MHFPQIKYFSTYLNCRIPSWLNLTLEHSPFPFINLDIVKVLHKGRHLVHHLRFLLFGPRRLKVLDLGEGGGVVGATLQPAVL